ncbi:MAG: endonuclease/exonuclease/phosphatase family protein, partial [Flavobacteriaceae bacterium]|nr:endonuclease/exonuclease/phosphatase family protein [Flavobacteriaceae bacterium]
MKIIPIFLVIFLNSFCLSAQVVNEKKYTINTIAFYNVENLFDTLDDPNTFDDDRTPKGKDKWTNDIYEKKLINIARVIADIGFDLTKSGPSIVGLCEIENKKVLNDLINKTPLIKENYGIVHYDSPDERGVDVAMLYKKDRFKVKSSKAHPLYLKRKDGTIDYTRDHLVVAGELDNDPIYFVINHWPSRAGGQMKSEPSRVLAGKLNKKIIDSVLKQNPRAYIINMGDFNDNPNDKSIQSNLNSISKKTDMKFNQLYNPMTELYKKGYGSYKYRGDWDMIDQFLLSKNLVDDRNGLFFLAAGVFNE